MSTINDDDYIIINRNKIDYKVKIKELGEFVTESSIKIQDSDYFLINRGNVDYKCTFGELKDHFDSIKPPPPEATPPDTGITVSDWTSYINADINPAGRGAIDHRICVDRNINPHSVWNSLVYTYKASTKTTTMYLNGKYMGEEIQQYVPDNDHRGSDLALFTLDPNNNAWRGSFHQWFRNFRMYDKALSPSEVKSTYQLDQDFYGFYKPSNIPGILVDIDARASRRNIDSVKNYCYVENLVNGSMTDFWWTDGNKSTSVGNYPNGSTHPTNYMEFDDTYGIWKVNDGRYGSNGGWVGSKFHPDINVDWTFQYTLSPLSIGKSTETWLMAIAVVNWTNISLGMNFNNCGPVDFP